MRLFIFLLRVMVFLLLANALLAGVEGAWLWAGASFAGAVVAAASVAFLAGVE